MCYYDDIKIILVKDYVYAYGVFEIVFNIFYLIFIINVILLWYVLLIFLFCRLRY